VPLLAAKIAATGFQLVKRADIGRRIGQALSKGFTVLADKAREAKFTATEKGFSLSAPGLSAQGGQAAQGAAARASYDVAGTNNFVPYLIGGALLLMLLKK
jgi:hypothetical protein